MDVMTELHKKTKHTVQNQQYAITHCSFGICITLYESTGEEVQYLNMPCPCKKADYCCYGSAIRHYRTLTLRLQCAAP